MQTPTNPDEAFDLTMSVVNQLKESGTDVVIKASNNVRHDLELVKRYNRPERVKSHRWVTVSFFPHGARQAEEIAEQAQRLGTMGIFFDTGGCAGQRDWELDFSFKFIPAEQNTPSCQTPTPK